MRTMDASAVSFPPVRELVRKTRRLLTLQALDIAMDRPQSSSPIMPRRGPTTSTKSHASATV